MQADGRIYDPVRDQYLTASEYESKFRAIAERTYIGQQVLQMVRDNNNYGPWHETAGYSKDNWRIISPTWIREEISREWARPVNR